MSLIIEGIPLIANPLCLLMIVIGVFVGIVWNVAVLTERKSVNPCGVKDMESEFQFGHLGINADSREEAVAAVKLLSSIFGLPAQISDKGSPKLDSCIEIVGGGQDGKNGHIAFYTENLQEAITRMEYRGVELDYLRVKRNPDGSIYLIYLKQEILGFAIHLLGPKY